MPVTFLTLYQEFLDELRDIYDPDELKNVASVYFEDRFSIKSGSFYADASVDDLHQFYDDLKQFLNQMPVQYIVGKAFFYEHFFDVSPAVLIPRAETEELVSLAIRRLSLRNKQDTLNVLDIGTGSGCIAVSVKRKVDQAVMYGLDHSEIALKVAKKNAENLHTSVDFIEMDFLNEENWDILPEFDFILSNPPYIARHEANTLPVRVKGHEPSDALFVPDDDPLIFYRMIFDFSLRKLRSRGEIILEISEFQVENLSELTGNYPGFTCAFIQDMQGKARILHVRKPD